jgi:hypothetical protein
MNCKTNIDDLQSLAYVLKEQMASRTVELSCNIPFLLRLQITRYCRVQLDGKVVASEIHLTQSFIAPTTIGWQNLIFGLQNH